jgi:hypothetical protein
MQSLKRFLQLSPLMKLLAAEQRGINMVTNYPLVASEGEFTQNTHPPSPSLRVGKGMGDG